MGVGGARPGGDRMGLSGAGVTRVGLRGATAVAPSVPGLANGSEGSLRGGILPASVVVIGRGIRLEVGRREGRRGAPPTGGRVDNPPRGARGRVVLKGGDIKGPMVDACSSRTSSSDEVGGEPFFGSCRPSLGPLPLSSGAPNGLRVEGSGGSRDGLIAPGIKVGRPAGERGSCGPRAL